MPWLVQQLALSETGAHFLGHFAKRASKIMKKLLMPNPHACGVSVLIDIGGKTAGNAATSGVLLLNVLGGCLNCRCWK